MQSHLRSGTRHLLIISDTAMWIGEDGERKVFEPALREIEKVQEHLFDKVTWLGFEQGFQTRQDGRVTNHPITFYPLPPSGGAGWVVKLKQVIYLLRYFYRIKFYFKRTPFIHTRGPSVPALLGVLLSMTNAKKTYWHKYAGNWVQLDPPASYAFQRWLLRRAKHTTVTVNGKSAGDPAHIKTFRNPCVEMHELQKGKEAVENRAFTEPYTLTFIGRVEQAKGADLLLQTLADPTFKALVKTVNVIGSVSSPVHYEALGAEACVPVKFWGRLGRSALQDILCKSHFIILPSRSEGFPKVIIEAAAYGVIPVVSDVSFISDHIGHGENGFLLQDLSQAGLSNALDQAFSKSPEILEAMARKGIQTAQDFTYSRFTQKLKQEVFYFD